MFFQSSPQRMQATIEAIARGDKVTEEPKPAL